jgi:hypothetical protein
LPIEARTSFGESVKGLDPARIFLIQLDDAELVGKRDGLADGRDGNAGARLDVRLDHLCEVHSVDVVRTDNDDDVGAFIPQQVEALQDGIGRSREPALAKSLLRWNGCNVRARDPVESPGLRHMAVEAVGLVLGQDDDLAKAGVDEIAQREINEPVSTTKRNGGLGAIGSERHKPFALSTSKDNTEYLL